MKDPWISSAVTCCLWHILSFCLWFIRLCFSHGNLTCSIPDMRQWSQGKLKETFHEKAMQSDLALTEWQDVWNDSIPPAVRLQIKVSTIGRNLVIFAAFYTFVCMSEVNRWPIDNSCSRLLNSAFLLAFHLLSLILSIGLPDMAFP